MLKHVTLKALLAGAITFFVLSILVGYLFDKNEYTSFSAYFQDRYLSSVIKAVFFSIIMTFALAWQKRKEEKSPFNQDEDDRISNK